MQIYIVMVGEYDDRRVVGAAWSTEQADQVIRAARESGEFTSLEWSAGQDTYEVLGPYEPGKVYGYEGVAI